MNKFFNSALKNLGIRTSGFGAGSSSEGEISRMPFSLTPSSGDSVFSQWHDAMKMVARLPGGIPSEFRKKLWITLSEQYLQPKYSDWEKIHDMCFSEKDIAEELVENDDDDLGTQIMKDLHRTGCSMFSGDNAEENQALLKRVLLAYAIWNKNVGYCQGFNMLAAIILEVMEWKENDALKVMIFLIEGVLPESYFANHLHGLSVDMAVFRDLLRMRLGNLSRHLDNLQAEAKDSETGTSYEPPVVNVFTMQWFLTLFSNCLPKNTVLRVWDLIFLEGNEVLLRTALAIWDGLADRIMTVESADEFYSIMGVLTKEMLEFGLMDANELLKTICTLAPFPFPQLNVLRDRYTYNIQPFQSSLASKKTGFHLFTSDNEDDDDLVIAAWRVSNAKPHSQGGSSSATSPTSPGSVFASIGPGAFGTSGRRTLPSPSSSNFNMERMTLDISALKKQYAKLRERQKQAHVILTGALSNQFGSRSQPPSVVNHLFIGKKPLVRENKSSPHITFSLTNKENPTRRSCPPTKLVQSRHLPQPSAEKLKCDYTWSQEKRYPSGAEWNQKRKMDSHCQLRSEEKKDNLIHAARGISSSSSSSSTELCDEDPPDEGSYTTSSPEFAQKIDGIKEDIGLANSAVVNVPSRTPSMVSKVPPVHVTSVGASLLCQPKTFSKFNHEIHSKAQAGEDSQNSSNNSMENTFQTNNNASDYINKLKHSGKYFEKLTSNSDQYEMPRADSNDSLNSENLLWKESTSPEEKEYKVFERLKSKYTVPESDK